jgi:hypothetical protein
MTISHKFTRRRFREAVLAGPAVIGVAAETKGGPALQQPVSAARGPRRRECLRAAIGEIIPASDGMPVASATGGLEYLERANRQEPEFGADIEQAVDAIEHLSVSQFDGPFARLSSPQRVRS